MTTTVLSWVREHRRNELLAERLGGSLHDICYGKQGNLLQAPFRYALQAWKTWSVLSKEQPDVVIAVHPPIFCAVIAYLYSKRYGAQFGMDSHTGAFYSPRWKWSVGLQRFLARRALITIAHNKDLGEIVKDWGCQYAVLSFAPGTYPAGEPFPMEGKFNIAAVSSFLGDEPTEIVFEAARRLDDVTFYMTGDYRRCKHKLLAQKPDNLHLTGFISYARYIGLLRAADATMVLTTRDHTLLMGAYEAISLGSPLITSDWPILRDCYSLGTVHVPNTVDGLCAGVRQAQRENDVLRRDIVLLLKKLVEDFETTMVEIERIIQDFERQRRGFGQVLDSASQSTSNISSE